MYTVAYERGGKIKKVPLFKGDLGGSKLFKQALRLDQQLIMSLIFLMSQLAPVHDRAY